MEYERFERDDFGHQSWVGRISGDPLSTVTLTWKGDVLSGGVQVRDALYRVRSADGRTLIEQLDPGSFGEERPPLIPPTGTIEAPLAGEPSRLAAGEVVDVAVFYTAAARAGEGGQPAIEALIAQGISDSNTAYARSNIQATMRLVGMGELAGFVESATDMGDDLRAFTAHPAVAGRPQFRPGRPDAPGGGQPHRQRLRHRLAGTECGLCARRHRPACYSQFTFTHETGHNFGNHHAPEDGASRGVPSLQLRLQELWRGHAVQHGDGLCVRIGANAPRILNLSNPAVAYSGLPSGHRLTEQRAVAKRSLPDRAGLPRRRTRGRARGAPERPGRGGRQHD